MNDETDCSIADQHRWIDIGRVERYMGFCCISAWDQLEH